MIVNHYGITRERLIPKETHVNNCYPALINEARITQQGIIMSDNNETRDAIDRICEAYGFTSRLQLAVYLGKTASYVNNKVARNSFPYDLVVKCALKKGVSLKWLVSGEGEMYENTNENPNKNTNEDIKDDTIYIPTYIFKESSLFKGDKVMFDKVMLPSYENELAIIVDSDIRYFIDMTDKLTTDGKYLIRYSDTMNIRDLTILPGNKIRIDWGKYPIDCTIDDIKISGKVVATYMEHKQ